MAKLKTVVSVADILERELEPTIKQWLRRVNLAPELTDIPLSDADRTGHQPKLYFDLIPRLRIGKDAGSVQRKGGGFLHYNRRFDMLPKRIGRLLNREQLAGGLGNCIQIGQKSATQFAILNMRMIGDILCESNQAR